MGAIRDRFIAEGVAAGIGNLTAGISKRVTKVSASYRLPHPLHNPRPEWKGIHEDRCVLDPCWDYLKLLMRQKRISDCLRFDPGRAVARGSKGWPDLTAILWDGAILQCECKRPGGEATAIQLTRLRRANDTVFGYGIIVCSVEGLRAWFDGDPPVAILEGIPCYA